MITYTGGTPRAEDWRDSSACLTADPELFFPNGSEGGAKHIAFEAKAICARCPVASDCLEFALNEGIHYGIYGGLDDHERRRLRRRAATQITAADIDEVRKPATLQEAVERHTIMHDGHLEWTGPKQLYFADVYYTPRRAAFLVGHGRPASGHIHPTCGQAACVDPAHLEDGRARQARKRAEERAAEQQEAAARAAGRQQQAAA